MSDEFYRKSDIKKLRKVRELTPESFYESEQAAKRCNLTEPVETTLESTVYIEASRHIVG